MRFRPYSKDQSKALNPEPKPEKKPLIINFDANGVRIGDDGYSMTPIRTRMHHLFNAALIWAIVCALLAVVFMVLAYAQGQVFSGNGAQDLSGFELVVSGGNMYNGYSVATILRYEALLGLITACFFPFISFQGFQWFYDRGSSRLLFILMAGIGVISAIYQVIMLTTVGLPDPLSLISLVILLLIVLVMRQVKEERPHLKKAKIASTITKK